MLRIVGAAALFFTEPFSVAFFAVYSFCGISDVVDGWIARSTNTISELGSKLDSAADLLFYASMLIKLLPSLIEWLPSIIWYFVAGEVVLRIVSYSFVAIKHRKFSSMHTYANKITGFLMFCVPYFVSLFDPVIYCSIVCAASAISSIEEFLIHVLVKDYSDDVKTIFSLRARAHHHHMGA